MIHPLTVGHRLTTSVVISLTLVLLNVGPAVAQTKDGCGSVDPSWSPDGTWIVFASDCEGNLDLYRIRPDGTELTRLTRTTGAEHTPRWSRDGGSIAYAYDGAAEGRELRVIGIDGGHVRTIAHDSFARLNPTWSPDGRRIAYESTRERNADIFVLDLDTGTETRLTQAAARDVAPAWSPDGSTIAFQSNRSGRYQIYGVDPEGSSTPRTLVDADGQAVAPAWSSDGTTLIFSCLLEGESETELCSKADHDQEITRLTRTPDHEFAASPAPHDGRLVFMVGGPPSGWRLRILSLEDGSVTELPAPGSTAPPAANIPADRQGSKPNVAILVFDGVQVIDHAIPFEVFGQYALNNVFTVARDSSVLTTYMGMRILPNYTFADHPLPDVIVIPGGNARLAREDPAIREWIRRNAAVSDYVLSTCVGAFFLADAGLLDGRAATTWYGRLEELAQAAPGLRVIPSELVVQDGKVVTSNGTGLEAALHVLALLHGPAFANLVRLNMEYDPIPDTLRVPRHELADLALPSALYAHFPWREAELLRYDGDRDRWTMQWRFAADSEIASLAARMRRALIDEDGWNIRDERVETIRWTANWRHSQPGQTVWKGSTELNRDVAGRYELVVTVVRDGVLTPSSAPPPDPPAPPGAPGSGSQAWQPR